MVDLRRVSRVLALAVAWSVLPPADPASAQAPLDPYRPHGDWRTVETGGFTVHYQREAEAWTLRLVERMESMGEAVAGLIGHEPGRRVTVLVADPFQQSNGFAISLLDSPVTMLWTTPPEPRSTIGEHRSWAELLFVHEYAHLAHLTYESRNPLQQRLGRWFLRTGPVLRQTPRWVREGYATFVEGRLTGHGRPHGVARPAFLRARALEGRLPTYAGLSTGAGYQDMANAYLVGSAYLEWLEARAGEDALPALWRRLSARDVRTFPAAFSGVFGGPPDELYGLFAVEVTAQALAVRDSLEAAGGVVEGEWFQRRRWHTGDPAFSPDGARIAVELHTRDAPSRLVIWETDPEVDDDARERARALAFARDTLDVPAVEWHPPARRPVATLEPVRGRSHSEPRFLPDGRRVLVTRREPLGDGTIRPDLFVWDTESGAVRRVTRAAGVRQADPAPDGRTAAAVRCAWGSCDLVRVDLASGALDVLAPGSPDVVFYRPRFSPDGATIVASMQQHGRWRLVAVPATGGEPRLLDPDDGADRYDAAFLPDGRALVAVSTRGGIPNLEHLDLETGRVRSLTRTLTAVAAPEPSPADGSVLFLRMHSRGWDVHRIHPDSVAPGEPRGLPADLRLVTASPATGEPASFAAAAPVAEPRGYGLGPRRWRLMPAGQFGEDGVAFHVAVGSTDPLGRLSTQFQAAAGNPAAWTGVAASAAMRRWPVHLSGEVFSAREHPSRERSATGPLDTRYLGALASAHVTRDWSAIRFQTRAGASAGRLDGADFDAAERRFAFAELRGTAALGRGTSRTTFTAEIHSAAGSTAGRAWGRWILAGGVAAPVGGAYLTTSLAVGGTTGDPGPYESFVVGGLRPILFDRTLLRQRLPMPALPAGVRTGDRAAAFRAALGAGPVTPFFWAATTDPDLRDWHRVVGIEQRASIPAAPLRTVPASDLVLGAAYSMDEPFHRRIRAYASLELRP